MSNHDIANHDKAYTVKLVKEGERLMVVAMPVKDRHSEFIGDDKILYEILDSPSIYYTIK